jgi:hypothetical protein
MNRVIACVLFVFLLSTNAGAFDCTLEASVSSIKFHVINRRGELATQAIPILAALEKINNKGTDPRKSLGEQLSQKDVASFAELSQRLKANQLQNLIVSGYGRDADVIQKMFEVANRIYIGGGEPQQGSPDYDAYSFLMAMLFATNAQTANQHTITVPPKEAFEKCTLEGALHLIENDSLEKLNKLPVEKMSAYFSAMRQKYNVPSGPIDPMKFSVEDRAEVQRYVRNVLAPADHEKAFADNIENLKTLAKASELRYVQQTKDANDSGGDINAVGTSFDAMKLDYKTKIALNLLDKIAEKVPSDWAKEMQVISNMKTQQQQAPR